MRRSAVLLTLLFCLFLIPTIAYGADSPIQLYLNGKELKPEVAPRIVDGNTIVPVRIIAEVLGAKVGWNGEMRKVTVDQGDMNIQLTIDNPVAFVRGNKNTLEVAPMIVDGNTLVPLRFIGEQLGVQFTWDGLTKSVFMYKTEAAAVVAKPETVPVFGNTDGGKPSGTPAPGGTTPGTVSPIPTVQLVQSIEMTTEQLIVKTNLGSVKPNVFKLSNPDRIVFDLPDTTLDEPLKKLLVGTIGELPSKHPLVSKIRFSNFNNAPATVRITLDLKEKADYKLVSSQQVNQTVADIGVARLKVAIDAGHGAHDPGAISITGKHEKDFTLAMAKKVYALLSKDSRIEILMTRSDDTFVELNDRVAFANDNRVDLFLSIHGNNFKPAINGVETYYNREDSLDFAKLIHKHTLEASGFADRGVRKADYRVITYTTMPAVLLEVGYLSNKENEAVMYQEAFQNQVAASLASAIKEYLNIK